MGPRALKLRRIRNVSTPVAELPRPGLDIVIVDIESAAEHIDGVVAVVKEKGRRAVGLTGDVSNPDDVTTFITQGASEMGHLDVVIAAAGIAQVEEILDVTPEMLGTMIDVNIKGVFYTYQAAAKQFIEQGTPGKIIGAASIVTFRPFPVLASYSMTKWAVRGLTQAAAMELAKHKITVNAYDPGIVGTNMWDLIDEKLTERDGKPHGQALQEGVDGILLGRVSVPEDVASLVLYLAGPDSDYMTGHTILIDGGINFT